MERTNITLRIHADGQIKVSSRPLCSLANAQSVAKAMREFDRCLKSGDHIFRKVRPKVLSAGQRLQNTCFPNRADFSALCDVIETAGSLVKIVSDDGGFLQLPWELFGRGLLDNPAVSYPCWGKAHVFQRTYARAAKERTIGQYGSYSFGPKAGFIALDGMPGSEEMASYFSGLSEIAYKGPLFVDGNARNENLGTIMEYLSDLDIAHLSCIILKLQYSTEPYLVFSNAFLLSLTDIKNRLRFSRCPVVLLDACDNQWHHMPDRLEFLKRFIVLGSEGIITSFYPIPRDLANEFARCFYEALVAQPIPVYEALLKAQNRLISNGEDLTALLFWLYGDPQTSTPLPSQTSTRPTDPAFWKSDLVKALARLYPDPGSAKRLISDGGLTVEQISFRAKPIDYWHEIVTEAITLGRLEQLLAGPLTVYSEDEQLANAYHGYRGLIRAPSTPPPGTTV